jgi:hypothetical protein
MARPGQIDPIAARVLAYLLRLDATGAGYERRGRRGWARKEDVEDAIHQQIPEAFYKLHRRELVDREDVSAPGVRTEHVHRISLAGAAALAKHQGRPLHHEVAPPGEPDPADAELYLPPGPLVALEELRRALDDATPRHLGETGWRTESELLSVLVPAFVQWMEETEEWETGDAAWRGRTAPPGFPRLFDRGNLDWLRRAGLAQRWGDTPGHRTRPRILWRVTAAGRLATPLTWHDPDD